MKKFFFLFSIFLFTIFIPAVGLAKVSVNLELDRSQALLTDSVQLTVSVTGSRDSQARPVIHGLDPFTVSPGGTSSRIEVINGKMSSGIHYTYFIEPRQIGSFKIGPAQVNIKGKAYASNTAALKVVEPAADTNAPSSPIFLIAELSAQRVYVEEQSIYILKLYLRKNVRNLGLDMPETENLVFKQLAKPREYRSTHNSKTYNVLELRYAVFPSKSGEYFIAPAKMSMTVLEKSRRSSRSPMDDPLFKDPFAAFSKSRPLTVAGPALQLDVRSLPEEGRPPDFSGLVGSFKVWSKLEPVDLKAGESTTLTIAVSGRGNISQIPDLQMPELDDIKTYADKPVLESVSGPEGLGGSKTMRWALIPEKDGHLEVPPLELSFFDTKTNAYRTLRSTRHTLAVLPGEKGKIAVSESTAVATTGQGAGKHAVKELGRDIFPVHTAMQDFKTSHRLELKGWLPAAVLGLPFFVYLGTLCALKFGRQTTVGQAEIRAKKAARKFYRQFRKDELTHSELLQLIRDYMNNRFGLSYGALTSQEAGKIIKSEGAGTDTAAKLQSSMQQLENAIYTGKENEAAELQQDFAQLIKAIEKETR